MFLHEKLPAGASLLPAIDTVHSRGFAGRSSASSSDRKCCISNLMYLSAVQLITEACIGAYKLRTAREDVDLPRKLHSSCLQWLYDHRSSLLTISQCLSVLETLVDCSMFVTVDKYLWRRTPAYGVSSLVSGQFIDCLPTHNTGRQHQANFPTQGGGKFCFEI